MSKKDTYLLTIHLPSKGKPYPDNPELAGPINISMLTTKDEKRLYGSNVEGALSDLVKECTDPSVDPDLLTVPDLDYILWNLRIHTYGDQYSTKHQCPVCGHSHEYFYSLLDMPVATLDDDFVLPMTLDPLPISGDVLEVTFLTNKDIAKIDKIVKERVSRNPKLSEQAERDVLAIASTVKSINGESKSTPEVESYLNDLFAKDSSFIEHKLGKVEYGYQYRITQDCPNCNSTIEVPVYMTSNFFRFTFN